MHKDIKTINILAKLEREGQPDMTIKKCYIADFGIARVLMNQHDSIEGKIGSQGFRAPELLKGIPYG